MPYRRSAAHREHAGFRQRRAWRRRQRRCTKKGATMSVYPYRNESLIQMETYHPDPARADMLIEAIRAKWALLREEKYAGDYPVEVLRSADTNGDATKIVEIFRWYSGQAKLEVQASERYQALCQQISGLTKGDTQ